MATSLYLGKFDKQEMIDKVRDHRRCKLVDDVS